MPPRTFVALAIAMLASVAGWNRLHAQAPTRIAGPSEFKEIVQQGGRKSEPMEYTPAKWAVS